MLFPTRLKRSSSANKPMRLGVQQLIHETPRALRIVFKTPDKAWFDYKSGQFITFIMRVAGKEVRRAYSLSSSPFVDASPSVVVKRKEGGLLSPHIHQHLKVGDSIEVMPPDGRFTYDFKDAKDLQDVLFFAGGSGITPIMSLLKTALKQAPLKIPIYLLYANQCHEEIIFYEALRDLERTHKGRFRVLHVLEEDASCACPDALIGRPHTALLKRAFKTWNMDASRLAQAEAFVCGPSPMMQRIKTFLKKEGMAETCIRQESFVAGETAFIKAHRKAKTQKVIMIVNGEPHEVIVEAGKTLLESGIEQGLDLPYSCQNGICGTCRGRLISGRIRMNIEDALSEEEKQNNYILCCQSVPLDDQVKVSVE